MEQTFTCLLMVKKLTILQQKILKLTLMNFAQETSKDWSIDNRKKTGINGYIQDFSVDYDAISASDIIDIQNCLIKKNEIVQKCSILSSEYLFQQ